MCFKYVFRLSYMLEQNRVSSGSESPDAYPSTKNNVNFSWAASRTLGIGDKAILTKCYNRLREFIQDENGAEHDGMPKGFDALRSEVFPRVSRVGLFSSVSDRTFHESQCIQTWFLCTYLTALITRSVGLYCTSHAVELPICVLAIADRLAVGRLEHSLFSWHVLSTDWHTRVDIFLCWHEPYIAHLFSSAIHAVWYFQEGMIYGTSKNYFRHFQTKIPIDLLSVGMYASGPQVLTYRPHILWRVRIWIPFLVPGRERRVKRFWCFRIERR